MKEKFVFLLLACVTLILVRCIKDDPNEPLTDEQAVSNAIDTLSIAYAGGESSTNVIATNGKVTRPAIGQPNAQVILTASLNIHLLPPFKNGVFGLDFLALSKQRAGRQVEQALSLDCDACLSALCVC